MTYLLYMKYLITESQRDKAALKWLTSKFSPDQLKIHTSKEYPFLHFYKKNGELVIARSDGHKYFYFDSDIIWNILYEFFGLTDEEIESLLENWIEDTFNVKGYKAEVAQDIFSFA